MDTQHEDKEKRDERTKKGEGRRDEGTMEGWKDGRTVYYFTAFMASATHTTTHIAALCLSVPLS
jgi:hypothetical protein